MTDTLQSSAAPVTTEQAPAQTVLTAQADTAPAVTTEAQGAEQQQSDQQAAVDTPVTPKDWATRRTEYAKGDAKLLNRLSRYSSEEAVIDALIAAQNKIAAGGHKEPLPEKPTPEQLTAWRQENGIPDAPEGYDVSTLPDGLIVGDEDRPIVDGYLKVAHEMNERPEVVKATVQYFLQQQEAAIAERGRLDEEARIQATIALRQEMGPEFETNRNLIKNMLSSAPPAAAEALMDARAADGTPIMSSPEVFRWLANLSREINPIATVVPNGNGNVAQALDEEMASLTKMMGDRNSDYWKGPLAQKHQARWKELYSFKDRTRSK